MAVNMLGGFLSSLLLQQLNYSAWDTSHEKVNITSARLLPDFGGSHFLLQILNLFVEGQRLSNAVCSERTDWQQYNDREKRLVQNTVMLVGLLYKMCKLQLVIPAKTEGALNRVDMDGAENRRSDAKMILRKIHESETKTKRVSAKA